MLGLFKRMLSKPEPAPAPPAAAPAKPVGPARPVPVARAAAPVPAARAGASAPIRVAPVSMAVQDSTGSLQPRSDTPPPSTSTHVQVALVAIAASLPEAISHKVPANPEQFVAVPVDKILPQLARGQVVLTAAELLECAPDYFAALAGHEEVPLTLPLGDIVKQLSAEHFARRNQRRVEVPEEVTSVFAAGGKGLTVSKAAAPGPAPRPQPTVTATMAAARPPGPAPAPTPVPGGKIPMAPQTLAAFGGKPTAAAPAGPQATTASPKPAVLRTAVTPGGTPPRSAATPLPRKVSHATKNSGDLAVPLGSVCKEWVEEVRAQLAEVDIAQSQILAPLDLLEPAMKSGKVVFSWQEVAAWIQPPLAIPPTAKVGEMAVELPLKVLAPLFMAHHRGATQQRVAVDEAIPDLFGGGTGKASAPK